MTMTNPVTFCTLPNGRIEALLDHILVGVVSPWRPGNKILGKVEATYRMLLPVDGAVEPSAPAMSMISAKRLLLNSLADWHEQADPVRYASMIIDLRRQAEGERG